MVFWNHAVHLGLVQHHLGYEDVVGIPRVSPRQIASVDFEPVEEGGLEVLDPSFVDRGKLRFCWGASVHGEGRGCEVI